MSQEIVGSIEGNDVVYIPEKDILFCKNTTIPYKQMKYVLFEQHKERVVLKKDLMFSLSENIVTLGCLTTTLENCENINKKIKKIKNGKRIG